MAEKQLRTVKLKRAMAIAHDGYTGVEYPAGAEVGCETELAASLVRGGDAEYLIEQPREHVEPAPKKKRTTKNKGAAPENK